MQMTTSQHSFDDLLEDLIQLRPFPVTASQLMAACDRPDVAASELCQIIQCDPSLTMKLLQIANSPAYGFGGEIRSVQHATVVVGLRALKNLAVSMAMGEVFGNGPAVTVEARQQLWSHALACGSIARTLAAKTNLAVPDEAFLSGVVHDVGKLLLIDLKADEYARMLSVETTKQTVDVEVQAFGVAHPYVGGECGRTWGLPDEVNDVILYHHAPDESDFGSGLVEVVCAANQLTRIWDTDQTDCTATEASKILNSIDVDMSVEEVEELGAQAVDDLSHVRQALATS